MVEILVKGGPTMIPLLLCSVLALAVAFERILYLLRTWQDPERALALVGRAISLNRAVDAIAASQKLRGQVGRLAMVGLANRNRPRAELEAELQAVGEREAILLESHLPILDTVVTIAPLLGLLGTVLGLIDNFRILGDAPELLEAGALSAGIAEALITTAAGLMIAVPAFVLHVYITGLIDRRTAEMSEFATSLVGFLSEGVKLDDELPSKEARQASS